jgi:nucleotide-binding universal stress UspA family protein
VDSTSYSSDVLPAVREIAKDIGASITLCHVIPPIGKYVTTASAPPGIARIMGEMIEESRELISDAATQLYEHGIRVKRVTVFGEPATAIVHEAESGGADLIAMATRGRDRLHKRVEGSVAQTVLESTRIPCLLVRPATINTN